MADLLYATLRAQNLSNWDIQLLLATAHERPYNGGLIDYKPFVQSAPEILEELRRRRLTYEADRKQKGEVEVPRRAVGAMRARLRKGSFGCSLKTVKQCSGGRYGPSHRLKYRVRRRLARLC